MKRYAISLAWKPASKVGRTEKKFQSAGTFAVAEVQIGAAFGGCSGTRHTDGKATVGKCLSCTSSIPFAQ